jgi:hypothetical protein
MIKDLLGPVAGKRGGIILSEPTVIAMGFAPALISFRMENDAQKVPERLANTGISKRAWLGRRIYVMLPYGERASH